MCLVLQKKKNMQNNAQIYIYNIFQLLQNHQILQLCPSCIL